MMSHKIEYYTNKHNYVCLIDDIIQTGGDKTKIFDLSDIKKYKFTNDLNKNLNELYENFGSSFTIRFNKIDAPVIMAKIKIIANQTECYIVYYNDPYRTSDLYPFKIVFIDKFTMEVGKNSYISDIHKTDSISGSEMVLLVLEINKVLGVKKTYLYDGTTISCGNKQYDLSFIKLIEKGITFYMKFGFDFDINSNEYFMTKYKTKKDLTTRLKKIIIQIKNIRIDDIIKEYFDTLDVINQVVKRGK